MLRWLLVALVAAAHLGAGESGPPKRDPQAEEERAQERIEEIAGEAADYRVRLAQHTPDPADDAAAQIRLDEARAFLAKGDRHALGLVSAITWARWHAEEAFEDFPYSRVAAELLHFQIECHALDRDLYGMSRTLQLLWFAMPSYEGVGQAMATALESAEVVQDFSAAVRMDAERPQDVVVIDGSGLSEEAARMFRFLAEHGDRETVAPRAAIGWARSLLLSGDKADRFLARRAYERFTADFPDHPLVFTAIVEQALTYITTYRGDDFDSGALNDAMELIDLAALETSGDAERLRTVQGWRRQLTRWQQQRDLRIARWYRARGQPAALAWLRTPNGLDDWVGGAHTYYQACIRRDRASETARAAERELADLPAWVPPPPPVAP